MKVTIKLTRKLEGDFYVAYFKEGRNKKGDKTAIYFAKNEKEVKKAEDDCHGEPVIVEKITPSKMKDYISKDKSSLQDSLEFHVNENPNRSLPILVGSYVD